MIGYETTIAYDFSISPLNRYGSVTYIFGLGWTPILLIIAAEEIWGYLQPNEDRELIRQRRVRGAEIDQELGIVNKPHWWRRLRRDHTLNVHAQIARNVGEIGGGVATTRNLSRAFEMDDLPSPDSPDAPSKKPSRDDLMKIGASMIFPTSNPPNQNGERNSLLHDIPGFNSHEMDGSRDVSERGRLLGAGNMGRFMDVPQPSNQSARSQQTRRESSTNTETSSLTLGNGAPPQKIRSMLDL